MYFGALVLQDGRVQFPRTGLVVHVDSALEDELHSHASPHAFASKTSRTTAMFPPRSQPEDEDAFQVKSVRLLNEWYSNGLRIGWAVPSSAVRGRF